MIEELKFRKKINLDDDSLIEDESNKPKRKKVKKN